MAAAIDPICKMNVDTENPPGGQSDFQDATYYFCAPGCKVAFDKEPEKYILGAEQDGHDDHHGRDHDHGAGGHSHGHHMPEREAKAAPATSKPGFFARLFGKK